MSVVYLFSGGVIPVGTPIVMLDNTAGICEAFDALEHTVDQIIGVVYPKVDTSDRVSAYNDGPTYYTIDYTLWTDELTSTSNINPNYQQINLALSDNYVRVCNHGFAPVLKAFSGSVPSAWKKIQERTTHDWFVL